MTPFLTENAQLGRALLDLVGFYRKDGKALIEQWAALLADRSRIFFCGMGTSEFTPLLIQWRLRELGYLVSAVDAGEYHYYGPSSRPTDDVWVLTSQSGESVEIRNVIEAGRIGNPLVAITNEPESRLGRAAALTFPLVAGQETSITTKTFTNNLALLYLLSEALSPVGSVVAALDDLESVADLLRDSWASEAETAAQRLLPGDGLTFVARGPALVSANQCALTFMEGTRCLATALSGGSFNHGPFEAVDGNYRLVVLRPGGPTAKLMVRAAENAARLGAGVVLFTDEPYQGSEDITTITVPKAPRRSGELLFPILIAQAQNRLLHLLARARGFEAGVFRYGSKITSHE